MNLPLKFLERRTQWANLAELYIGLLKDTARKDMKDSDSPLRFWDYCAERSVLINNLISKNLFQLNDGNVNLKIVGETDDISNKYHLVGLNGVTIEIGIISLTRKKSLADA